MAMMKNGLALLAIVVSASASRAAAASLTQMPGLATSIGAGNGEVWILGADSSTQKSIWRWNGTGWDRRPGAAVKVSVSPDGQPWVIDSGGVIYRWNGSGWDPMPGCGIDVAADMRGSALVLGCGDYPNYAPVYQWNGSVWVFRNLWMAHLAVFSYNVVVSFPPRLYFSYLTTTPWAFSYAAGVEGLFPLPLESWNGQSWDEEPDLNQYPAFDTDVLSVADHFALTSTTHGQTNLQQWSDSDHKWIFVDDDSTESAWVKIAWDGTHVWGIDQDGHIFRRD